MDDATQQLVLRHLAEPNCAKCRELWGHWEPWYRKRHTYKEVAHEALASGSPIRTGDPSS